MDPSIQIIIFIIIIYYFIITIFSFPVVAVLFITLGVMDLNNDETEYMPGENPEKLDKAYRDDTFAYCSIILGEEKQL